jgi:Ca2+-binding RTX toxin-like protein
LEIDGINNRVTVTNSSISNNGTVVGDPDDELDVDGNGNLILVQQSIFDSNTEDGLDIEGANNRLLVENSTFTNNGRSGILVQDDGGGAGGVGSTSTATISISNFTNNARAGILVEDLNPDDGTTIVTSPVIVQNAGGGDPFVGGEGDDDLGGGLGRDRLEGRGGDDELDGGGGDDLVRGGSGSDTFRFDDDGGGFDTIQDFRRGVDVLTLNIAEATFRTAFGDVVNATDPGVDALDPDNGRGVGGGTLVIDFSDPGIPGGAPGDSVLTIFGVNELFTNEIVFV